MASRKQSSSDPLPYSQVDRAVKPKAALLAGYMGVSTQHALGSLIEFWDLCGDPREIERIIRETPRSEPTEVLLPRAEVERRFALASGKPTAADVLASLGLLEQRGETFRVRGMSRYIDPIERRVLNRIAASAGGKASAISRRESTGTAQPGGSVNASENASGVASTNASGSASENASEMLKRPLERNGSVPEVAVSGQRSTPSPSFFPTLSADADVPVRQNVPVPPTAPTVQAELATIAPPKPAKAAKAEKAPDPRHHPLKLRLIEAFARERDGARYEFTSRDGAHVSQLLAMCADDDEIVRRWRNALTRQYGGTGALLAFVGKFNDYAGTATGPPRDWSKGRVAAEDADHSKHVVGETKNAF